MKRIKPEELFHNVRSFLEDRGVELKDGSYTNRIRQGCNLLSEAVNATQTGLSKAKAEIDDKLERMRQVIHEKTAPKPPPSGPAPSAAPGSSGPAKRARRSRPTPAARKPRRRTAR